MSKNAILKYGVWKCELKREDLHVSFIEIVYIKFIERVRNVSGS